MIQLRKFLGAAKRFCQYNAMVSHEVTMETLRPATGCVVTGASESYQKCEESESIVMQYAFMAQVGLFFSMSLHQVLLQSFRPELVVLTAAFSGADFLTLTGSWSFSSLLRFRLEKDTPRFWRRFCGAFFGTRKKMDYQSVKRSQGMAKMGLWQELRQERLSHRWSFSLWPQEVSNRSTAADYKNMFQAAQTRASTGCSHFIFLKRFGCQISLSSQPGGATLVPRYDYQTLYVSWNLKQKGLWLGGPRFQPEISWSEICTSTCMSHVLMHMLCKHNNGIFVLKTQI